MKIGFDNDKYLKMQSEHIRERINQFGNKLYLNGGKLLMTTMLPEFFRDLSRQQPRMLMQLDQADRCNQRC